MLLQRLRLRLRLGWVGWSEAVQELGAVVVIATIAAAVLVLSKVMRPVLPPPGPTRRNDPTATAPYTRSSSTPDSAARRRRRLGRGGLSHLLRVLGNSHAEKAADEVVGFPSDLGTEKLLADAPRRMCPAS